MYKPRGRVTGAWKHRRPSLQFSTQFNIDDPSFLKETERVVHHRNFLWISQLNSGLFWACRRLIILLLHFGKRSSFSKIVSYFRVYRYTLSPHVRESGFRNPGIFCLWNPESWALESGIQHSESGIQLTKDPLQINLSYSLERKVPSVYVKPHEGIDLNVTT